MPLKRLAGVPEVNDHSIIPQRPLTPLIAPKAHLGLQDITPRNPASEKGESKQQRIGDHRREHITALIYPI